MLSDKPSAWMRRWAFDGIEPKKERNANGRMVWPARFKFLPVTVNQVQPDDVPLYAQTPDGVAIPDEAERSVHEQTLAGLVKRLAYLVPKDHAARIVATEYLQKHGYLSPLRETPDGAPVADPLQDTGALGYAARLADGLWRKHYREDAPNWQLCPDLLGILTQIDNMTTGLMKKPAAGAGVPEPSSLREPAAWRFKERVNDDFDTDWILTKYEPADGVRVIAKEPLFPPLTDGVKVPHGGKNG